MNEACIKGKRNVVCADFRNTEKKLSGAEKRAFARRSNTYSKSAALLYDPPVFIKVNSVFTTAIGLIGTLVIYYAAIKSGVSVDKKRSRRFTAALTKISRGRGLR